MASDITKNPVSIEPLAGGSSLQLAATDVQGVKIIRFPRMRDVRGELTVGEFGDGIFPFQPQRHFVVFGVPPNVSRGEHAHKRCQQLLICVHGRCVAMVDDGTARREFVLDDPSIGLYVPPLIWGTQHSYSGEAVLLVFASEPYDASEYIRDYDAFRTAALAANR